MHSSNKEIDTENLKTRHHTRAMKVYSDLANVYVEIPWWRHQMETFSELLAICAGNSPVTGEFPAQRPWRGALMFSLISARINGWVNTREAGDLRHHRALYDVSVINSESTTIIYPSIQIELLMTYRLHSPKWKYKCYIYAIQGH